MDVQRYISSGVIENYVTGLISAQEKQELEQLMLQYPEIKAAVDGYQEDIETLVLLDAVQPPTHLRTRILTTVKEERAATSNGTAPHPPKKETIKRNNPAPTQGNYENPDHTAKVIPIRKSNKIWRYAAVAAILLLGCSLYFNYVYFDRYNAYRGRVDILADREHKLSKNNEVFQTKMQDMEKELNLMKDPGFKWIKLNGVATHTGNVVTICWNPQTKAVYILPQILPPPGPDKQYQLWAITDGKPVDAGVFEPGYESGNMLRMKNIEQAQVFAVTLENKGGNSTPSMDQLFVTGKVAG